GTDQPQIRTGQLLRVLTNGAVPDQRVGQSVVVINSELLVQGRSAQTAVHNAHRTGNLRSQDLAHTGANPAASVSRLCAAEYHVVDGVGTRKQEKSLHQLAHLFPRYFINFQGRNYRGERLRGKNRSRQRLGIRLQHLLRLAQLVQQLEVSAHDPL